MESSNKTSINGILELANTIDIANSTVLKDALVKLIDTLINNDFNSLVQLLYQIDVDENKLKQNLKKNQGADSASVIADMIIKRQLQKLESAKKTRGNKREPGEEDW